MTALTATSTYMARLLLHALLAAMLPGPHQGEGFLATEQALELSHKGVNLLGQFWVIHLTRRGRENACSECTDSTHTKVSTGMHGVMQGTYKT